MAIPKVFPLRWSPYHHLQTPDFLLLPHLTFSQYNIYFFRYFPQCEVNRLPFHRQLIPRGETQSDVISCGRCSGTDSTIKENETAGDSLTASSCQIGLHVSVSTSPFLILHFSSFFTGRCLTRKKKDHWDLLPLWQWSSQLSPSHHALLLFH